MNAPEHIKGPILATDANLLVRVERWRWVTEQHEAGTSFKTIGKALGIYEQSAFNIHRRGDPSLTVHQIARSAKPVAKAVATRTPGLASTPWDHDGERPALDPRLTMAKVVSPPRLTVTEMFVSTLRAELERMRASA